MKRLPPTMPMKEEDGRLLGGETAHVAPAEAAPMQAFMRAVARYILQVSIEEEATSFLGREHCRRGERGRPRRWKGYEAKRVQTEAWVLKQSVLQLRATAEHFRPALVKAWSEGVRPRALQPGFEQAILGGVRREPIEQEYRESHQPAADAGLQRFVIGSNSTIKMRKKQIAWVALSQVIDAEGIY